MKPYFAMLGVAVLLMTMTACMTPSRPSQADKASQTAVTTTTAPVSAATSTTQVTAPSTTTTAATTALRSTTTTTTAAATQVIPTTEKTTAATQRTTSAPTTARTTTAPTTVKSTTVTTTKKATTTTTTKTVTTTTTKKPTTTATAPNGYTMTAQQLALIEEGFLRLVNEERARVGVAPLASHAYLDGCAQLRSTEIIELWSHTRPNGEAYHTIIDPSQYAYTAAAENIGMTTHVAGYYYDTDRWTGSAEQIEAAYTQIYNLFKNSSGHYQSFTNAVYTDTGIGISYIWYDNGIPMFYVSQVFGAQ